MTDTTPEIPLSSYIAERDAGVTVDVREREEYAAGHVPGARSIPMSVLPRGLEAIPATEKVFVICASGNRSRAMTDLLRARGLDAVSVAGGTQGWITSGRPVDTGL